MFATLVAQFVHVKSSLHQFAALTARGCTLVETTSVIVSVVRSVCAGIAQAELCKLEMRQQQACTKSAAAYIYPLVYF